MQIQEMNKDEINLSWAVLSCLLTSSVKSTSLLPHYSGFPFGCDPDYSSCSHGAGMGGFGQLVTPSRQSAYLVCG